MKTRLAWLAQAALIVLPVLILSGVALHFLHEDRTAIEQESKDRAAALAPEAARRLRQQIGAFLAEAGKNGRLIRGKIVNGQGPVAMPDYQPLPAPADWPSKLPPHEAQLWQTAKDATFKNPNAEVAKQALASLSAPGVSAPARANAQLSLLIAAEPNSDANTLIRQAIALAHQYPEEVTESGAPIADLALFLALRHAPNSSASPNLIDAIDKTISLHPSFLSVDLMNSVSGTTAYARLHADWLKREADRANTRNLMGPLYPRIASRKSPSLIVYRGHLAFCAPNSWGWQITLVDLTSLLQSIHPDLPNYMGAFLMLDGRSLQLGAPGRTKYAYLAATWPSLALDATYRFPLVLDLRNPDLLYAPYRRRLLLTQWLIFSAVAAALFGLWRLWQTYLDQTRLNEMKSNLVSSVSHELRAPIAAVRLMAESLETGRVDGAEKQKDYYRLIVRECRRLSSLVENVLDFSRIDQGRKQYHREPVDAPSLLRHTVMLMEPGAAERNVRLRLIDPPPAFETLQPSWDAEAIEQSLVNLLDNAIKHSAPGSEVRIEVELLAATIRFWVIDAGPGIPPDEHRKIFDLFYRYGSELRRETEGVGIGLSIVKHVAEAHGGRVLVESNPGQGSRFGLELPR